MRREIPSGLQVVPSLLAADFAHLAEEVADVDRAGAAMLHLDVMDGHFVPEITFGQVVLRSLRAATTLFLDTHLMIRDPGRALGGFVRHGADLVTLHAEALGDRPGRAPSDAALAGIREARRELDSAGRGLGLSFKPGTDPRPWLEGAGELLDLVLIMTVEPGFGGQPFMADQVSRIAAARDLRQERGWRYRLEVDGGIAPETAGRCAAAGAELLVAGTAVFGCSDRRAALGAILAAAGDRGGGAGAQRGPGHP